jgi:hypothetical protein
VNDKAIIHQISHQISHQMSVLIYKAVIAVQQQQAELLIEKYRSIEWSNSQRKSELIKTVSTELIGAERLPSQDVLIQRFEQVLKAIFIPDFFKLNAFRTLVKQAEQIVLSQPLR